MGPARGVAALVVGGPLSLLVFRSRIRGHTNRLALLLAEPGGMHLAGGAVSAIDQADDVLLRREVLPTGDEGGPSLQSPADP
jgi:hypothetical protein